MAQVLSQQEVDALLAAVAEGEIETEKENKDDSGVVVYDLTAQDRVIRGRIPTLDLIYERFIRYFRMTLSTQLRRLTTLNVSSTDLLKFGEFLNTLPLPSCLNVLRIESLRGSALMVIESKLAYALVDTFLGGNDRPFTKIEGKEFTHIELSIVRRVVMAAIEDLERAWEPVHKMNIGFVRSEVNPQFVGIVPPSDVVIVTTFEVELENASGVITLVIPYRTIEPIKNKLSSGYSNEAMVQDRYWRTRLVKHLEDIELNILVNLGRINIQMKELMDMRLGDVIQLDVKPSGELDIFVEGITKFQGLYGIVRGRKALQITQKTETIDKRFLEKEEIVAKSAYDDLS